MKLQRNEHLKKRREEQMRLIKQGLSPVQTYSARGWNQEWEWNPSDKDDRAPWNQRQTNAPLKKKREKKLLVQFALSILLVAVTFIIFSSPSVSMQTGEKWIQLVMTRDFNFKGLAEKYKQFVGDSPSILPAFFPTSKEAIKQEMKWYSPVKGEVVLPFDEKRKGVVIRTQSKAVVHSAGEGWVTFAGYKEGLGNTVIVRYGNGNELWYGWLTELQVREKDWVKGGQKIGGVAQTKGQSLVYLALKRDKQFLNPVGVIPFD